MDVTTFKKHLCQSEPASKSMAVSGLRVLIAACLTVALLVCISFVVTLTEDCQSSEQCMRPEILDRDEKSTISLQNFGQSGSIQMRYVNASGKRGRCQGLLTELLTVKVPASDTS